MMTACLPLHPPLISARHRPYAATCRALMAALVFALGMLLCLPAYSQGDAQRGNELFQQYCQGCHGEDGRGGRKDGFMPRPQNLTKKGYIDELPDEYLVTVITKGGDAVNKSGYMPAFGKKFSNDDIKNLIAFIRSLARY